MIAKLVLFCLMLGLAAANRFVFTPALTRSLEHDGTQDLGALRASVLAETLLAVLVLALVAWLGVMPPPEAG
jgi:putative copper resistance protein D